MLKKIIYFILLIILLVEIIGFFITGDINPKYIKIFLDKDFNLSKQTYFHILFP